MNDFSYYVMGKEKINALQDEGMRNQAVHRAGSPKPNFLRGLPKLMLGLLGILSILGLLVR
jgi:hypothetical protein